MRTRPLVIVALAVSRVAAAPAADVNDEMSLVQRQMSRDASGRSSDVPDLGIKLPMVLTDPRTLTSIMNEFAVNFRNKTSVGAMNTYLKSVKKIWAGYAENLTNISRGLMESHTKLKGEDDAFAVIKGFLDQRRMAWGSLVSDLTEAAMQLSDGVTPGMKPFSNLIVGYLLDASTIGGFEDPSASGKKVKRRGRLSQESVRAMADDSVRAKQEELMDKTTYCTKIAQIWQNVTFIDKAARTMVPYLENGKSVMEAALVPMIQTLAPDVAVDMSDFFRKSMDIAVDAMSDLKKPVHQLISQLGATSRKFLDCSLPADELDDP